MRDTSRASSSFPISRALVEKARARCVTSAVRERVGERTNERTNDDGDDAIGTDRGGMEETNRDFVVGIFVVAKKNAKNGGFSGGD